MRITVGVAAALVGALLGFAADSASSDTTATKKKTATKTHAATRSTAAHSSSTTTHTPTRRTAAKKGKKGATHTTAARAARQTTPTPERYKEIQEALVSKGYLPADQANGQWNDGSLNALKRFQADQNLEATGKINSLSLIALGLGPKHETAKPASTVPVAPPPTQQP